MKSPKVSIIIPNWNGKDFLKGLFDSLRKQSFKDFEIIMVDNGSNDGSKELVKKSYPEVKIIELEKNLGFSEPNNIGARAAKGKYLVLLNNDMVVDKDWLKELVEPMEKHNDLASVSSLAYNKYERGKYEAYFGTSAFFGQNVIYDVKVSTNAPLIHHFGIAGGSCIIRNEGQDIFDKEYFAYSEDTYYGWLKRLEGKHNVLNPKSFVYHEGEATSKKIKSFKFYLQERNRMMNVLFFYSPFTLLRLLPLLAINIVAVNAYDPVNIPNRLKAYGWLLINLPRLLIKRWKLQGKRKVSDFKVVKYMSGRFYDEGLVKNKIAKSLVTALNILQLLYCYLTFLWTYEFYDEIYYGVHRK